MGVSRSRNSINIRHKLWLYSCYFCGSSIFTKFSGGTEIWCCISICHSRRHSSVCCLSCECWISINIRHKLWFNTFYFCSRFIITKFNCTSKILRSISICHSRRHSSVCCLSCECWISINIRHKLWFNTFYFCSRFIITKFNCTSKILRSISICHSRRHSSVCCLSCECWISINIRHKLWFNTFYFCSRFIITKFNCTSKILRSISICHSRRHSSVCCLSCECWISINIRHKLWFNTFYFCSRFIITKFNCTSKILRSISICHSSRHIFICRFKLEIIIFYWRCLCISLCFQWRFSYLWFW